MGSQQKRQELQEKLETLEAERKKTLEELNNIKKLALSEELARKKEDEKPEMENLRKILENLQSETNNLKKELTEKEKLIQKIEPKYEAEREKTKQLIKTIERIAHESMSTTSESEQEASNGLSKTKFVPKQKYHHHSQQGERLNNYKRRGQKFYQRSTWRQNDGKPYKYRSLNSKLRGMFYQCLKEHNSGRQG